MFENVSGVRFKGAAFKNETSIKFFKTNGKHRASILFGRNGSGKSTISKAILKACEVKDTENPILNTSNESSIEYSNFVNDKDECLDFERDELNHIFVFNEEYINKNIQLSEDGLNTIVMFGEQIDLSKDIENKSLLYQKNIDFHKIEDKNIVKLNSVVEKQNKKIKTMLHTKTNSWARRYSDIRGNKTLAKVNDDTAEIVFKAKNDRDYIELVDEFKHKIRDYTSGLSNNYLIEEEVQRVNLNIPTDEYILGLLNKIILNDNFTEREKMLIDLASNSNNSFSLNDIKSSFSKQNLKKCPYCLQPISQEYKSNIMEEIAHVLNEEAQNHIDELNKTIIQLEILQSFLEDYDFERYNILDSNTINNCNESINNIIKKIDSYIEKLNEKKIFIYKPIRLKSFNITSNIKTFSNLLLELEHSRVMYNNKIKHLEDLQNELYILNNSIAYHEIKKEYTDYIQTDKELKKSIKDNKKYENEIKILKMEISNLQSKMKNVSIAANRINDGLKYIFVSKNRLSIEAGKNHYKVISKGDYIKPNQLSSGERNAIALCYFFNDILSNLNEKNAHKQECFLVIDDPVSSFDLENRIGILSYLKKQMKYILKENTKSKIIIMTHDLPTYYDISNIFKEFNKQKVIGRCNEFYQCYNLENHSLSIKSETQNEYLNLLKILYNYAADPSEEYDLVVGNIARRVIEAFTTFEYSKGLVEVLNNSEILESIDEGQREYFMNKLDRFILNGESHMQSKIKYANDYNFTSSLSKKEKQIMAQDILCLMYNLNKMHIINYFNKFNEENKPINNLKIWCKERS